MIMKLIPVFTRKLIPYRRTNTMSVNVSRLIVRGCHSSEEDTNSSTATIGKSPIDAFERKHHLGRQLSKLNISREEYREWKQIVKYFRSAWTRPPHNFDGVAVHTAPHFEVTGLLDIKKRSEHANVLLEVRDCRLPASTHHPSFSKLAYHRRHLICYTHADMIDAETRSKIAQWTAMSWPKSSCMFVDTRETRSDSEAFGFLKEWVIYELEKAGGVNYARKYAFIYMLLHYIIQH